MKARRHLDAEYNDPDKWSCSGGNVISGNVGACSSAADVYQLFVE